jgi:hypothetical protein
MIRWVRLALELVGILSPKPPCGPGPLTQSSPPPLSDTQPIPLTKRGSGERPRVIPPKR